MKNLTIDSNVFISAIKGNEEYSEKCRKIISGIGIDFLLYQPTISITEIYNSVGKVKGKEAAEVALKNYKRMVFYFESYFLEIDCERVGRTALDYEVYSSDAFFLQTSIDYKTTLISLDEKDFVEKIKKKDKDFNVFHVRGFMIT